MRSVRRKAIVVVSALLLLAAYAGQARATVSVSNTVLADLGMDLQCVRGPSGGSGQLTAFAPHPAGVFSTYASDQIYISTQVDRWDGTRWVYVGSTAEWAYGNTNVPELGRTSNGYPLMYILGSLSWISTGVQSIKANGQSFNYTVPQATIPVASGSYYRAFTWLRDARDGDRRWVQNTTPDGSNYCLV